MKMCDISMSQQEIVTFIVTAPFLGTSPDKLQDSSTSPFCTSIQSVATSLESKPAVAFAPNILRELVNNAWKADKFYRIPNQNISLFKSIIKRISLILESVIEEWSGSPPENGILSVDHTLEFYRLWSAFQFVFCLPSKSNEDSTAEIFGDGLMWAGCTIIYFLGQQHKFDVFDFSYHILNVEESAPAPCNNINIQNFFKKASEVRDLNQSIFNTLKSYCPLSNENILIITRRRRGSEFITKIIRFWFRN